MRRRRAWLPGGIGKRPRRPGYYVLWNEYARGRKITHSRHFLKQADARRWCREFNARRDLLAMGQVLPISIEDAAAEFAEGGSALAPATLRSYAIAAGLLCAVVGEVRVCDLTGRHIDAFVSARMAASRPATVAKHIRSLRRLFRWCIKRGYADRNPIDFATSLPRSYHVRQRPQVTMEDVSRLLAVLDTEDRRLAVQLAATSGLDRGVIEHLTADQIDLANRCIKLQRPKSGVPVVAYLSPAVADAFSRKLREQSGRGPLLRGLSRTRRDWWKAAVRKIGVPDLTFRDLRAVASAWMQQAVPLAAVQKMLGHTQIQTTYRHYSDLPTNIVEQLDRLPQPSPPSAAPKSEPG